MVLRDETQIIDRDQIIETEIVGSNLETGYGMFTMYQELAKIGPVVGFVFSHPRFALNIIDFLVDSPASKGSDLVHSRIAFAVSVLQAAVRQDAAEEAPIIGQLIDVGTSEDPKRNPRPLKNALRRYEKFAEENHRENVTGLTYFVEQVPYFPPTDIPRDRVAITSKFTLSQVRPEATRPLSGITIIAEIARVPEVRGVVISGGVYGSNFFDLLVSNTGYENDRVEAQARAIFHQFKGYSLGSGNPLFGGLVPVDPSAGFDVAKQEFLKFARLNRRRETVAAYFLQGDLV